MTGATFWCENCKKSMDHTWNGKAYICECGTTYPSQTVQYTHMMLWCERCEKRTAHQWDNKDYRCKCGAVVPDPILQLMCGRCGCVEHHKSGFQTYQCTLCENQQMAGPIDQCFVEPQPEPRPYPEAGYDPEKAHKMAVELRDLAASMIEKVSTQWDVPVQQVHVDIYIGRDEHDRCRWKVSAAVSSDGKRETLIKSTEHGDDDEVQSGED